MVAALRVVTFAFLGVIFAALAHADIIVGTKRDAVIAELGKPTSAARRGPREILLYPKNVRIELEADAVIDIKGYTPATVKPPLVAPAPASPAPPPAAAASTKPIPAAPLTPSNSAPAKKPALLPAGDESNPAIAANTLGDEVSKMDTAWGPKPTNPIEKHKSWPQLIVGFVVHFIFTVLALLLAFKYWEMDAFLKNTLAIAAIDTAQHAGLELLGPVTGGLTTMSGVQNSLPALVMIFTIRHFCFNKRIQNAVLTAGFVKVLVMLGHVFLSIALLNAVFG